MAEIRNLPHTLALEQRSRLTVTGASEVLSLDEDAVVLQVGEDTLQVLGRGLKLKQLTPEGGNVAIEGQIDALTYAESASSGSWLSRLLG